MDIHRCRFVDYTPHTITSLAFSHSSDAATPSPAGLRLAVGRSNGDIEIWNPRYNWTHELTLPGARGRAIEGLVWAHAADENPRLFSIGGSTYITEWDLSTGRPRANYDCNAGVVWCVDANASGDKLAVGCDDGSVVIVDLAGGRGVMEHDIICQRQDLRVLGIKWYGDDLLIGGCADGKVRCWAAKGETRGRLVNSMKVDKSKTESTLVWSIVALPSREQFVTGDSTGAVKFWDAKTFTLLQGFTVHEADVLSLARDASGEKVYSAGIDRKIHQYSWLENSKKKSSKWIHSYNRLLHLNDVRSLAAFESKAYNFLVSGGVERSIIVQSAENFANGPYKKILMNQQISNISVCAESKLVALFQDQTVKVWRILEDEVKHKLVTKLSLADDDNITSISIGEPVDGISYMAVSTINSVKVFELSDSGNKLKVRKIRDSTFDEVISGAKRVLIFDENNLLIHTPEDEIYKFTISESSIELEDEIESVAEPTSEVKAGFDHFNSIKQLTLSSDHSQVIVARFNNTIEVLPLTGDQDAYVLTKLSSAIHLMDVVDKNNLVVITEENKLYELTMEKDASKLLSEWSQRNSEVMPLQFLKLEDKPQGMFVDNRKVWVYGSQWLAFFDLTVNFEVSKLYASKARKRNRDGLSIKPDDGFKGEVLSAVKDHEEDEEVYSHSKPKKLFWITDKYRPILKVDCWGENEITVVEREAFALPTTSAFEAPLLRI